MALLNFIDNPNQEKITALKKNIYSRPFPPLLQNMSLWKWLFPYNITELLSSARYLVKPQKELNIYFKLSKMCLSLLPLEQQEIFCNAQKI